VLVWIAAACGGTADSPADGTRLSESWAAAVERGQTLIARLRGQAPVAAADADTAPPAPELRGHTHDGQPFDLADWQGSPVVLIFLRSHDCGLCVHRLQQLESRIDDYQRLGARVVVVSADDGAGAARPGSSATRVATAVTVTRDVLEAWGIWSNDQPAPLPAATIVDPRGRLAYWHLGRNASDRVGDVDLLAELGRVVHANAGRPR